MASGVHRLAAAARKGTSQPTNEDMKAKGKSKKGGSK
jgi:hypothetical protein